MPLRPLNAFLLLLAVQLVVSSLIMKRDRNWRVPTRLCRNGDSDFCMFAYKRNNAIYTAAGLCTCDETTECQLKKRKETRWYFTCQVPLPLPEEIYDDDQTEDKADHSENAIQLLRLPQ